jgi:hypothetical protein
MQRGLRHRPGQSVVSDSFPEPEQGVSLPPHTLSTDAPTATGDNPPSLVQLASVRYV